MSDHQAQGVEQYRSTLVHGENTAKELVSIQCNNPTTYHAAMEAVNHSTQRRLVWAVVQSDGRISYTDLDAKIDVCDRTKRKHLQALEDNNLLQRIDANYTFVEFGSLEAEVLLRHALSTWYDSTA
jgi:hypothetical protein